MMATIIITGMILLAFICAVEKRVRDFKNHRFCGGCSGSCGGCVSARKK